MKTITQMALSNIKHNRSRSILIGISILLTSCLLMVVGTVGQSIIVNQTENAGVLYGEYEFGLRDVQANELDKISHQANIDYIGVYETVFNTQIPGITASFLYMDENAFKVASIKLDEGEMPKNENEIVATRDFLQQAGAKGEVGETVKIPYRVLGKGEIKESLFTISGIMPENSASSTQKRYGGYVSKSFSDKVISPEDHSYTAIVKLSELKLDSYETGDLIYEITDSLEFDRKNVSLNMGYISWSKDPSIEVIVTCVFVALIIISVSCLVIYNIFYVGIVQRVQEYGKLRAIGASKRQIRSLIRKEGYLIGCIFIPLGIILGLIISKISFIIIQNATTFMPPEAKPYKVFFPSIILLVIVVSFITIMVSLSRPAKVASKISPVDAIRFQNNKAKEKNKRKGHKNISLILLIISNMSRNKRRTISTILTMGLSCIMFVSISHLASSLSVQDLVDRDIEKGDFVLSIDYSSNDETYPENNLNQLHKRGLLGENTIKKIEQIDGVTKVEIGMQLLVNSGTLQENNDVKNFVIQVLDREAFDKVKKEDFKRGTMDYDTAVKENGVIYCWDNSFDESGIALGDRREISVYDGDNLIPLSVQVQGTTASGNGRYIMTEDTLAGLKMENLPITSLYVYCEQDKYDAVKEQMQQLTDQDDYYILTRRDEIVKMSKLALQVIIIPIYIFLGIIGAITFMNMANTMITSIITRKKELGTLQAIGLTNRQLTRMLTGEGLILSMGSLVVSLIIGNILGYRLYLWALESRLLGIRAYHFPTIELLCLCIIVIGIQLVLSAVMTKNIQKETLIERIRYHD